MPASPTAAEAGTPRLWDYFQSNDSWGNRGGYGIRDGSSLIRRTAPRLGNLGYEDGVRLPWTCADAWTVCGSKGPRWLRGRRGWEHLGYEDGVSRQASRWLRRPPSWETSATRAV